MFGLGVALSCWVVKELGLPYVQSTWHSLLLVMPNIFPTAWIAGRRVEMGMSLATAVKALWSDQAVRGSKAGICGSK